MMDHKAILAQMKKGSKARLIPVVTESKKEERATSALLSTFMVVPQFTEEALSEVGARVGIRSNIDCYTEVTFRGKEARRPDGVIFITSGKKCWSALIEAKVGNAELNKEQIEDYLDLARELGINAVITISNQFATKPTHHPIAVSKQKTHRVELYHLSWLMLLSKAQILSQAKSVDDREQAIVLHELVRYLSHPSSGVSAMTSMSKGWGLVCAEIQQGASLRKGTDEVSQVVNDWLQLMRYLSLTLSTETGAMVEVALNRAQSKNLDTLIQDTTNDVVTKHCLSGALSVPNTASRIEIAADLRRRVLAFSMSVTAPGNKSLPTASINWLTRQLKHVESEELIVKAVWPGHTANTQALLSQILEDPKLLVPEGFKEIPRSFEVSQIVDLGGRFKGARVFVETISEALPRFYALVGQNLSNWVPTPPKAKKKEEEQDDNKFPDEIKPEQELTVPARTATESVASRTSENNTVDQVFAQETPLDEQ